MILITQGGPKIMIGFTTAKIIMDDTEKQNNINKGGGTLERRISLHGGLHITFLPI